MRLMRFSLRAAAAAAAKTASTLPFNGFSYSLDFRLPLQLSPGRCRLQAIAIISFFLFIAISLSRLSCTAQTRANQNRLKSVCLQPGIQIQQTACGTPHKERRAAMPARG